MNTDELKKILDDHALWIADNGGSRADLTGANLTRANLTGANLTRANLTGANLTRANLTGADLYGANLTCANLTCANLTRANLTCANLTCANLTRANLTGANLTGANLYGASKIAAFGPMPTSGRIITAVRHDTLIMVKAGCFFGTVAALRQRVLDSHNCPVYLAICDILDSPNFKFNGE